ncbi:MAG: glycoside hydrolase family 9 protein [Verrucomicrobia bacterium]|nr:glycoside hydrolase family 9 protein [Verrucomicrobiota bacterium]
MEADFSSFTTPGEYRLAVPGLGTSWPFRIDEGVAMALVRAYALGLYHQRCGTSNDLPFTRFVHGPCHTAPAEVPDRSLTNAARLVGEASADYALGLNHTAPRLKDFDSRLYPFVNHGRIDVAGGHHDAGDYSKYTVNSASFVHILMFAVDAFPDVAELDNLGLPESGDGISDLLQEAKWEADFLAKMQDADGGFYYLVYPRDRAYESDVLPDRGDSQIVWPKTTAATAAAVAALAQCASSPLFQRHFPEAARTYLEKAGKGWAFLSAAMAWHGKDGSYQKLISYGNEFQHDDEVAWAACELFLATGQEDYHRVLRSWFDPDDAATRRWTWWRLFDAYGHAIRSYALASRAGRQPASRLDPGLLDKCERQLVAAGEDMLARSRQNAYGTSLPLETKGVRSAGWYFSSEQAFDIAAASLLRPNMDYVRAFLYNFNYEAGCNPVNVCYVTGLGLKRPREMVHQFALNDRRVLPPSGFPIGNIQDHLPYLDFYRSELGLLTFPSDGAVVAPYPSYDRWTDTFNVMTEFTIVHQARSLVGMALLAVQTSLKNQPWKPPQARITGLPREVGVNMPVTARVEAPGLNLEHALIVWEARDQEPSIGSSLTMAPTSLGAHWVEVEAQLPDGRRVFGSAEFMATNALPTINIVADVAQAAEAGSTACRFTFTRTGSGQAPLTVRFNHVGTATKWDDYRTLQGNVPDSVTIHSGAMSETITFYVVDDGLYEGPEVARLALLSDETFNVGTPSEAAVNIEDNDRPAGFRL